MPLTNQMTEHEALQEIDHIQGRSVSQTRWYGWAWLVAGVGTFAFLMATPPGGMVNGDVSLLIALAFGVIGAVMWYRESRQTVVGRVAARIDKLLTAWYIGLFLAAIAATFMLLPEGYSAWLVPVALLPVVPCAMGVWKVFRS